MVELASARAKSGQAGSMHGGRSMSSMERRIFRRFRVEPILCQVIPPERTVCVLRDVSLNGALFLSPNPPPVGSILDVRFREPPLEDYNLQGTVVRHEQSRFKGFGVVFDGPHPKLLRAVYHTEY